MAGEGKRIGLREVRALGPGEIISDAAVAGFCARRQKGAAVTYYAKYRFESRRVRQSYQTATVRWLELRRKPATGPTTTYPSRRTAPAA